jgi:hypothetical protein
VLSDLGSGKSGCRLRVRYRLRRMKLFCAVSQLLALHDATARLRPYSILERGPLRRTCGRLRCNIADWYTPARLQEVIYEVALGPGSLATVPTLVGVRARDTLFVKKVFFPLTIS